MKLELCDFLRNPNCPIQRTGSLIEITSCWTCKSAPLGSILDKFQPAIQQCSLSVLNHKNSNKIKALNEKGKKPKATLYIGTFLKILSNLLLWVLYREDIAFNCLLTCILNLFW